jgi:hypothetical protein
MILAQDNIYFSTKGPELEGGVGEFLKVLDHLCPDGIAIDIPDAGEVVFIGVDDAGVVSISPQVSGSPDMLVEPDGDPGIEILHGPMEVFLGRGGDDVVVVGHEDDMVNEKVIFFIGFPDRLEHDAGDLPLVEPEGSVVGPADQVVGELGLDDAERTSHTLGRARSLPTFSIPTGKVL